MLLLVDACRLLLPRRLFLNIKQKILYAIDEFRRQTSSRGKCDQKQARFRQVGEVNRGEKEKVAPSLYQETSTKNLEHFFLFMKASISNLEQNKFLKFRIARIYCRACLYFFLCDDCPSNRLDVWMDGTYLRLLIINIYIYIYIYRRHSGIN